VLDDQGFRLKCKEVIVDNIVVIIQKFNEVDQENIEIQGFQDYIRYFLYLSEQTDNYLESIQQVKFSGVLLIISAILEKSSSESVLHGITNFILLKALLSIKEPLNREHKNMIFILKLLTKHANLLKEFNFPLFYSEFLLKLPDSNLFPRCKFNSTRMF
jgi:hypothetical protein